jgi:hypothetical protein
VLGIREAGRADIINDKWNLNILLKKIELNFVKPLMSQDIFILNCGRPVTK